jgi:protein ImuB
LLPLPIASLRLPPGVVSALAQLGIDTVGDLTVLPRADIPARFGAIVLQRLDQALGRLSEVITPHRSVPEARAYFSFEYTTDRLQVLFRVLDTLSGRVHAILESRNEGARQVQCWLYHEAAEPCRLEVSLYRPSRSPRHISTLLRIRLEQVRLPEPVSAIGLHASVAEPLSDFQDDFLKMEHGAESKELAALIDHLSSRLGTEAVSRAALVPDVQPEYAWCQEPFCRDVDTRKKVPDTFYPFYRPLRLWSVPQAIETMSLVPEGPPLRFRWAGEEYRIAEACGPERIETGWWRGQDVHRDYYVVTTHIGTQFWLFRRRDDGRWFLHGAFD